MGSIDTGYAHAGSVFGIFAIFPCCFAVARSTCCSQTRSCAFWVSIAPPRHRSAPRRRGKSFPPLFSPIGHLRGPLSRKRHPAREFPPNFRDGRVATAARVCLPPTATVTRSSQCTHTHTAMHFTYTCRDGGRAALGRRFRQFLRQRRRGPLFTVLPDGSGKPGRCETAKVRHSTLPAQRTCYCHWLPFYS